MGSHSEKKFCLSNTDRNYETGYAPFLHFKILDAEKTQEPFKTF